MPVPNVEAVEQTVKQFFAIEKEHIQAFLDYLAKRPLGEVLDLVRRLETAKAVNLTESAPVAPANEPVPVDTTTPAPQSDADAGVTTSS